MQKKKNIVLEPSAKEPVICEKISKALQLSEDILNGGVLLSIQGNRKIYIENYRSLMEYTSTYIRIQSKYCPVIIEGKNLEIAYYGKDEMCVAGEIHAVYFRKEAKIKG